jgi:hypothetical protein
MADADHEVACSGKQSLVSMLASLLGLVRLELLYPLHPRREASGRSIHGEFVQLELQSAS